jgi:hypothetical protein
MTFIPGKGQVTSEDIVLTRQRDFSYGLAMPLKGNIDEHP